MRRKQDQGRDSCPEATFFDLEGSFGHQFSAYIPKNFHQAPLSSLIFINALEISQDYLSGLTSSRGEPPLRWGPVTFHLCSRARLAAGWENWSPSVCPSQPSPRLVNETEKELTASAAQGQGDFALCWGQ